MKPIFRSVSFSVWSGVEYNTHREKNTSKYRNISYGLLASREFENIYVTKNEQTFKAGIRTHDPRITITAEQY